MTVSTSPPTSEKYFDLGDFHRQIITTSSEAQIWFDRGLCWIFGFHPDEALVCAENALANDPSCIMAHWLYAAGNSPNYARQWAIMGPTRDEALSNFQRIVPAMMQAVSAGTEVEKALCEAVVHRFPKDDKSWDFDAQNKAYADAMGKVYERWPEDLDIAALYADALMCITPWRLWDLKTGEPLPESRALKAKQVLERGLLQPGGKQHPGILHMYIHLTEMSTSPEIGIPSADTVSFVVSLCLSSYSSLTLR